MIAVKATLRFSGFDEVAVFSLHVRIEATEGPACSGLGGGRRNRREWMSDRSNALCRAIGAGPARLAAWPASRAPSSGIAISKAKAVVLETPGMLVGMAKRSERLASASTNERIAASTVAICRSICSKWGRVVIEVDRELGQGRKGRPEGPKHTILLVEDGGGVPLNSRRPPRPIPTLRSSNCCWRVTRKRVSNCLVK
jgi:hypothetical protein